jgi:hypothetical protein
MTGRPISPDEELDNLREVYRALTPAAKVADHPDEDMWARFACDELSDDQRDHLVDHVLSCAECAEVYRAVTHVRHGAAAIDAVAPRPAQDNRHRTYAMLALAATALIAVAAAVALRSGVRERAEIDEPNPPAAPAAPRAEPRAWARNVEVLEVRLPAALALTVRGTDPDQDAFLEEFGDAIAPYREGRYVEAVNRLAALAARRPEQPEVAFYLGLSHLLAGDPAAAVLPLIAARRSEVVAHEARWYQAVALERAARIAEANTVLNELCDMAGAFKDRACAAARGRP